MHWDLFCRVVDNFGDIGVCWRLAADLASRGERVRLWADDPSALAWMAPQGAPGVEVRRWTTEWDTAEPGDVVVEAFGCHLPAPFVRRMAQRTSAPVWINLEYLSAEPVVERNHGLASPQLSEPGKGLSKWFFYPGFVAGTGGLIREPGLIARQENFDAEAWWLGHGLTLRAGERAVSLFCYANPAVPALLDRLATAPTLLAATAGPAADQVRRELGPALCRGALRAIVMPWLTQQDYDALLCACDLNFVRGEDSFVRAQWAGKPFVWQIYRQHDHAHQAKLNAFLGRFLAAADATVAREVRALWRAWNGVSGEALTTPSLAQWRRHAEAWRAGLLTRPDMVQELVRFVSERR